MATARVGTAAVATCALALVVALAVVDVTQGTAAVGPAQVWDVVTGRAAGQDASVVLASRLPRALAGILVGLALGAAGAALQSVTRNVLASPDTLAVDAGAYAALAVVATGGAALPAVASSSVALAGGLIAAVLVLVLAGGAASTPRLVLAGSALSLGLASTTSALLLLFPQQTAGLYRWGQGSTSQSGPGGVEQVAPLVAVGLAGLVLLGRRLDVLALGDDAARGLGLRAGRTRLAAVALSVLLVAAAVTLAGPLGFVGLAAPAAVRLAGRRLPGLHRARPLLLLSALVGAVTVLACDVALRAVVGAQRAVEVPTGVVTTLGGAVVLVGLALRSRAAAAATPSPGTRPASRSRCAAVVTAAALAVVAAAVAGVLLGDAKLLLGDVATWLTGRAGPLVSYVLETRLPRVAAALTAGAALALAGTAVQAVTRNPLAEPGLLGVSGGAGLAAVLVVTAVPLASAWLVSGAALAGAVLAAAVVFGLSLRGGSSGDRLVLVGVGASAASAALISFVVITTDPFDAAKALTWLSGSTYGRTGADVVPVLVVVVVGALVLGAGHRELDLIAVDDDVPRLLGVPLGRARAGLLAVAVLLTATAVAAVGVIGFVGLVAPHAARALVGPRHARALPVAALLGALLVSAADTAGRTVVAPAQLGAGLLTAVLGTPYFLWLLWRSRRPA